MEKKRLALFILIALSFVISACGKATSHEESKNQEEINTEKNDEKVKEQQKVKLYYVNPNDLGIVYKEIEIKSELSDEIVLALINEGILVEGCAVNHVKVDSRSKKMEIDINKVFGDRIRSMGTAGEEEIIQCTARTFLDAYMCEKILIKEEGKELETGHRVIEEYLNYR